MRVVELDYVALWLIFKFVVKPIFKILRNFVNKKLSLFSLYLNSNSSNSKYHWDDDYDEYDAYDNTDFDDSESEQFDEAGNVKQRPGSNNNNPTELPQPKRVLYPRENVRVGWQGGNRKWQVGVGMSNVGNTCYLNSTLQALFHVPSMANWLLTDAQTHQDRCEGECIVCAMSKTLFESQTKQSPIRPYHVYSKLKSICKHLVMGRQEDAHEFLRYLVEAMEKSYLSRYRNHKELDQYSKETTPMNQILGGYLKSAVRCLSCGHVSVTFQHFQDLLLDIRKADSVEEALDGYFSRERLEDMGYKCESCKKKVSATKQFSLERAPIALCIQLKRFSMMGNKLSKNITIKPRLDLSKYASRKGGSLEHHLTYKLVAMVTHLGASQHCGHYTAIGLTESGTYYNYDDSYVRPISVQNVCNTNAYIIFYEMETLPPPLRQTSSTQVSGSINAELQQQQTQSQDQSPHSQYQKMNGCAKGVLSTASSSPQRIIGPQLPPGGLNNGSTVKTPAMANGSIAPASPSASLNGSKLNIHRQGAIPTGSSLNQGTNKIVIHFKHQTTNATAGQLIKSVASSSTTTATATSSSCAGAAAHNTNSQFGTLMGASKFQDAGSSRYSLASSPAKTQVANDTNGSYKTASQRQSRSPSPGFSSNNEDEVSSSTQPFKPHASSSAMLPSMPQVDCSTDELQRSRNSQTLPKADTSLSSSLANKARKSLVPYDDADSDEEPNSFNSAAATLAAAASHNRNPLKRRNGTSSGSSCCSEEDEEAHSDNGPSNGIKIKKAGSNSFAHNNGALGYPKSKSRDAIDAIFNTHKQQQQRANSSNSSYAITSSTKIKQKSQSQQLVSSSTSTAASNDCQQLDDEQSNTRPPFKRSNSTPPSPPVVKTPTGLWQVSALNPEETKASDVVESNGCSNKPAAPPKNPKNPFAKSPEANNSINKRSKPNQSAEGKKSTQLYTGGYFGANSSQQQATVSELLKQSHRGYGAPVLTWSGQQTEIDREIMAETREQRQREWDEEEENEMDRGRQKSVKAMKEPNHNYRTPGYNPFQEMESANNQRRWKHGGANHSHRMHGGHFRKKMQQNKLKAHRFNGGGNNGHHHGGGGIRQHQQQRHNGGGLGNSGSNVGFNRRDS